MFPFQQTIGALLTVSAQRYPNHTALVHRGVEITYYELNSRVNRLANSLLSIGIKKGDHVAYIFENSIEIVEVFFALHKIGAVAVALNHRLMAGEISALVNIADCTTLIYSKLYASEIESITNQLPAVRNLICAGDGNEAVLTLDKLIESGKDTEPEVEVFSSDLCRIQFTGGTTGMAKGVLRTNSQDLYQALGCFILMELEISPNQVFLNQCPIHHQAGSTLLVMCLGMGGTFVIGNEFRAEKVAEYIQKYKASFVAILPPSVYLRIADMENVSNYDFSSVKNVFSGAGLASETILDEIFNLFPQAKLLYGWGSTEVGMPTMIVIDKMLASTRSPKLRSIGKKSAMSELKIIKSDGTPADVCEKGECFVRGPMTTSGYYKQEELGLPPFEDAWVPTGDILYQDNEGYYYIADRKKDMIKPGGENVFSTEVESVIRMHPAVEECAVIGVEDRTLGEAIMAIVKLRSGYSLTLDELQTHCRKHLSSYKKPKHIRIVDSMPKSGTGKILKYVLRQHYNTAT